MTAPRSIVNGTTYLITRRCSQREELAAPLSEEARKLREALMPNGKK